MSSYQTLAQFQLSRRLRSSEKAPGEGVGNTEVVVERFRVGWGGAGSCKLILPCNWGHGGLLVLINHVGGELTNVAGEGFLLGKMKLVKNYATIQSSVNPHFSSSMPAKAEIKNSSKTDDLIWALQGFWRNLLQKTTRSGQFKATSLDLTLDGSLYRE